MNNLIKKGLVFAVILLFIGLAFAPSINAVKQKTIEDKTYNPNCIPLITYPSYIYSYGNFSEIYSPIPPGTLVCIPYYTEFSISIPKILEIIPWPLNTLWLFFSTYHPVHWLYFTNSYVSDYIYVHLFPESVPTTILLSGEISNSSNYLIIEVGENAPCGIYNTELYSYCKDIGRIKGDEFRRTITFEVEYE